MTAGVAELSLDRPLPLADWLPGALAELLDAVLLPRVVLLDATGGVADARLSPAVLKEITLFELPVVFVFDGPLQGPAAELALAADIRICSESGSLQGRLFGNARARTLAAEDAALRLFLGREPLPAAELLRAGLVTAVTPRGKAREEAHRIATVIASRGPIATRLGKEAVWRGLPQPLDQALRFETDLTLLLQTTKDRAEGVRAFLEKRVPIFTGE